MFTEEFYRVVVEFIEVQGLVWPAISSQKKNTQAVAKLPSPIVEIRVGGKSRWTSTEKPTASFILNRLFVFKDIPFSERIEAKVYHQGVLTRELIGSYSTTLEAIRSLPNNCCRATSFPIRIPDKPSEPRGFIRLSIHVLKAGELMEEKQEAIESSVRIAPVQDLSLLYKPHYILLSIYQGQDIMQAKLTADTPLPSPSISVRFTDSIISTSCKLTTVNPVWNEMLRIPTTLPNPEDNIILTLMNNNEPVASTTLSLQSVINLNWEQPSFINFYTTQELAKKPAQFKFAIFETLFDFGAQDEGTEPLINDYVYLGRICISALVVYHSNPTAAHSIPVNPVSSIQLEQYTLWISLMELAGIQTRPHEILVTVSHGAEWSHSISPKKENLGALAFDINEGQLPALQTGLPVNLKQAPNIIIQVYILISRRDIWMQLADAKKSLIAYSSIPLSEVLDFRQGSEQWFDLTIVNPNLLKTVPHSPPISILSSISLSRTADLERLAITRMVPKQREIRSYQFTGICYQAFNLPVFRSTFPMPHIRMRLGGVSKACRALGKTIHPDWNEAITFQCTLPADLSSTRDLEVQVVSHNVILGRILLPVPYLTSDTAEKPKWYTFNTGGRLHYNTKVLLAFKLKPIDMNENPTNLITKFENFALPSLSCTIHLFLLGYRLFSDRLEGQTEHFKLRAEYGRKSENPQERLWSETIVPSSSSEDIFSVNLSKSFEIKCLLAKSHTPQAFIELRLIGNKSEAGIAYLHVTPHIPWLTDSAKKAITSEFFYQSDMIPELISIPQKAHTEKQILPMYDLISNASQTTSRTNEPSAKANGNYYFGQLEEYVSDSINKQLDNPSSWHELLNNLEWLPEIPETNDLHELSFNYERTVNYDMLPYQILPILAPTHSGSTVENAAVIGLMKARCLVTRTEPESAVESSFVKQISRSLSVNVNLKLRVHVYSGIGFVPTGTITESEMDNVQWFLQLWTGIKKHNIINDSTYLSKGLSPEFYRSYEIPVQFPRDALLTLCICRNATFWNNVEIFGQTLIDLETRCLQNSPGSAHKGQIELRTLRDPDTNMAVGRLKCSIHLIPEELAVLEPLAPLVVPQSEIIQIRVVIWSLKKAPSDCAHSFYVKGIMASSVSNSEQETDTHWNSTDGTAKFNWRFVFDVSVPCSSTQLRLQVWNKNLISAHESIAESVIDLSSDLTRCKQLQNIISLRRATIRMTHPQQPTEVRGYLDVEISIVPEREVKDQSVGLGREEPNCNPVLPPVTENRNYISTSNLGENLFAFSNKIAVGAKITTYAIAVIVIAYIVLCISKIVS